jgi:hypothetical protein
MSNEQSLRKLKIFRELSCNAANHQRNQKKIKKEGAYINLVFFILIKLYKKLLLELKLYRKLRLELKKYSLKQEFDKKKLFSDSSSSIFICISITGGIGDVISIARWIRQVKEHFGMSIIIDAFFTSPEMIRFILQPIGVRDVFSDLIFRRSSSAYDAVLTVNQFVISHESKFKMERILSIIPEFNYFIKDINKSLIPYQKYINYHPELDGLFADLLVEQGLTRKDFLSVISGFDAPNSKLPFELPDELFLKEIGLNDSQYITIHDGWEVNVKQTSVRSTKSYPVDLFARAIVLIKKQYPSIKIVQVGSNTDYVIEGVDINLLELTNLAQCALILKQAKAHIDTESGLVHLATSLGTSCVVMFGPTNISYYGYAENKNIKPKECGNCMHVTDTWMESCPLNYTPIKCMPSILPNEILMAMSEIISN